jgi:hypothetical protein
MNRLFSAFNHILRLPGFIPGFLFNRITDPVKKEALAPNYPGLRFKGRGLYFLVLLMVVFQPSFSQTNRQLKSLHDYLAGNRPPGYDSTLDNINYIRGGNLNYLYPLYQLFGEEDKFRKILTDPVYNDMLTQAISFTEDYESVLEYQKNSYDSVVDEVSARQIAKLMDGLKNVQHVDARRYISFLARNYRVIMLNEAHDKSLHRAFACSLLEDLYKKGFRYLAMEMLNNYSDHRLDKLTPATGHYSSEPVAGELIRTALDIGYQLVSYEDTAAAQHTATQRDSVQAANIYRVIQADSTAKIFVYAGYGHIAEKNISPDYIPMGMAFKRISGIDPLTIDQTNMTEGGNFTYGKAFYDAYVQKFSISTASVALIKDEPQNVTFNNLYDLSVIHPRTTYRDGRATWLDLFGRRQALYIKPSNANSFLVQAYYQFETFGNKPGQVIPADQTYTSTNKGNYLLYLKRGKYIIVFRDINYKILNTQHIEVN